jgi:hypothetical protein
MATDKYPNQNVNVPMKPSAVAAARARMLSPALGDTRPPTPPPHGGKGSQREIGPGQWIDDRVINASMRASPSKDSPPELPEERAIPATFDPTKVYEVVLGKSVEIDGRWRSPSNSYQMVGAVAEANRAAIIDATELGDIPTEPDVAPSGS